MRITSSVIFLTVFLISSCKNEKAGILLLKHHGSTQ